MTEGNIAAWKVKEDEPFGAGDVLLEIETDKATMGVEAQDDGVMVRIVAADGSKSVRVGSRIAVVAEPGDNVAALKMSPDEQQPQPPAPAPAPAPAPSCPEARPSQRAAEGGETHEQRYPLMPAVEYIVKQHGLPKDAVARIKPTGPNGRLLKGDVLAFLGAISPDSPAAVSSRLERLSHLDLGNIKVAAAPAPQKPAASPEVPVPQALEVRVPVSLAKVVEVQRRIQDTLDIFLPLSTFVSRAAEVANDDLPPAAPTPSELFDQVLGLDKVEAAARGSRGVYLPQITAVAPPAPAPSPRPRPQSLPDIIDELADARPRRAMAAPPTAPGVSSGANVFSLVVPREEQQKARALLERCKMILEKEPGRLVL